MNPVRELAVVLRTARALPDAFADDEQWTAEVGPWAEAARVEAAAGLAALRLLQQIRPVAALGNGTVQAVAPDADDAMQHAFVLLFTWQTARRSERVVFGPRFALYTPVVQLADGLPGLDVELAVREDENAIDALCRLALRAYQDWCPDAGAAVAVVMDGEELPTTLSGLQRDRAVRRAPRTGSTQHRLPRPAAGVTRATRATQAGATTFRSASSCLRSTRLTSSRAPSVTSSKACVRGTSRSK
jgi:hypothetical protein